MSDENGTSPVAEQPQQDVNGTDSQAPAANGSAEVTKAATDAPLVQAAPPEKPADHNAVAADSATSTDQVDASDSATANGSKDDASPSATATPASGKAKRKSTSGVPEHKSKKLNKKKSMPNLNLDAQPGDFYWARWRNGPGWPAVILAQDMLTPELLAKRPVSAQQEDGTYRADFQEGGKNAKDRQYPILFLGENNTAWIANSLLNRLDKQECAGWEEKKLSKNMQLAYQVALEAPSVDHFRAMLNEAAEERMKSDIAAKEAELAAEQKREEADAAKAAKAAEPKPKKPRKSKGANDGDSMDVDPEAATEKPSKKRKQEAISDSEQPAKKPAKVRLSTSKASKDKSTPAKATPAKKSSKSKKTAEKEEPEEEEKDPAEAIHVAIMFLRHKLQKGFLSREAPVDAEEMPQFADYLAQLEAVPELEGPIIRSTKIHKVLKNILKLPEIPRDESFNFSKRCAVLLKAWEQTLAKDGPPTSAVEPADGKPATANGVSKSEDKDKPAATDDTGVKEEKAGEAEEAEGKGTEAGEKTTEAPAAEAATEGKKTSDEGDATEDVTMADAQDEKIAPGSSEDKAEPAGDESTKALEANAGEAAA